MVQNRLLNFSRNEVDKLKSGNIMPNTVRKLAQDWLDMEEYIGDNPEQTRNKVKLILKELDENMKSATSSNMLLFISGLSLATDIIEKYYPELKSEEENKYMDKEQQEEGAMDEANFYGSN